MSSINDIILKSEEINDNTYFYYYDETQNKIKNIIFITDNENEKKLFWEKVEIYNNALKEWNNLYIPKSKNKYNDDMMIKYKKYKNSEMEFDVIYKNNGCSTKKGLTLSNLKSFLALDEITVCGGIITMDRYQRKGIATQLYNFIDIMPEIEWTHIPHSYAFNSGHNTDASLNIWKKRELPPIKDTFLTGLNKAEIINKKLSMISAYGNSNASMKRIEHVVKIIQQNENLLNEYQKEIKSVF